MSVAWGTKTSSAMDRAAQRLWIPRNSFHEVPCYLQRKQINMPAAIQTLAPANQVQRKKGI